MYSVGLLVCFGTVLLYLPTIHGKRELPSYVKVCNRNQNDLNDCVKSSILGLKPYLGKGIAEMKLPPFDPLHVTEFVVKNGDVEFKVKDVDFGRFNEFDLKNVILNWKRCYAKLEVVHPVIPVQGTVVVTGTFLGIPLDGATGSFKGNMTNVEMTPEMKCIILRRRGSEYLKFTDIDLHFKIGDVFAQFNLLPDKAQNDNLNNLLRLNMATVIEVFGPLLGKALGEVIRRQAEAGFESFPLDVLLPE